MAIESTRRTRDLFGSITPANVSISDCFPIQLVGFQRKYVISRAEGMVDAHREELQYCILFVFRSLRRYHAGYHNYCLTANLTFRLLIFFPQDFILYIHIFLYDIHYFQTVHSSKVFKLIGLQIELIKSISNREIHSISFEAFVFCSVYVTKYQ